MSEVQCDNHDLIHSRRHYSYATSCDETINQNKDIKQIDGYDQKYLGYYDSQPSTVGKNGCLGPETVGEPCDMHSYLGNDNYKKVIKKGLCVFKYMVYMG